MPKRKHRKENAKKKKNPERGLEEKYQRWYFWYRRITSQIRKTVSENVLERTGNRQESRNRKAKIQEDAKMGVAYYSNQIIQAAKIRIEEQREDFELKKTMTDMQEALTAINQLSGDIGTWDIRKIKKEAAKMDASSGGAGKSLMKTLKIFRTWTWFRMTVLRFRTLWM